LPNIFYKPIN